MAKITFEIQQKAEEQIRALQKEISYNVKDFTIGYIIEQFQEWHFYIPDYQREYVWQEKNKCKFIESVILWIPIPFMFVCEMESWELEIIDWAQRIQTIEAFINNDFKLKNLEKLEKLNGFNFSDLPEPQQKKFKNRSLRIIVLEQNTTEQFRQEIFSRINTSWRKVNPAEVRRWAYKWEYTAFITECANNPLLTELCKFKKELIDRREPEELVLRFFAYLNNRENFKHDVSIFLDKYLIDNKDRSGTPEERDEFMRMLAFVNNHFPYWFAKEWKNQTPRVRFEAIAVGVAEALRVNPEITTPDMSWLSSKEFEKEVSTHASNSYPRLNWRINFVKNKLLNI